MCFPTLEVVLKMHQWRALEKKKKGNDIFCVLFHSFSSSAWNSSAKKYILKTCWKKILANLETACIPELNNFVLSPSIQQFPFEIPVLDQSLSIQLYPLQYRKSLQAHGSCASAVHKTTHRQIFSFNPFKNFCKLKSI